MLISIGLYAFIAGCFGPASTIVSPAFIYAIVALAAAMVGAVLMVRWLMVEPAESILAGDSENAAALKRWRAGYLVTFVASEAVALYGIVLRFMGVEFRQAIPFFVAGFILMLFFGPRRPSHAIG
jgi:hypothetical protein